jgi:hypothetical protein
MVKYIVDSYNNIARPVGMPLMTEQMGSHLLSLMEEKGMKPPERYRKITEKPSDLCYADWIQLPSKVYQWEDEDEKK